MSVASGKPAPPALPPAIVRATDPQRTPKVRQSLHLYVPRVVMSGGKEAVREGVVTVTEMLKSVRLSLDMDNDGIGVKHVDLSLSEAAKLSEQLNLVRRRVIDRKASKP